MSRASSLYKQRLVTDAGIAFYSPEKKGDLGQVLQHVLQDEHCRVSLAQRCWAAQQRYFSWTAIAARYAEFLRKGAQAQARIGVY